MVRVRFMEAATRELAELDKVIARRIVKRIRWLADNLGRLKPEALAGDLAGLYKLRVGDYRVVYEILEPEQAVLIHLVGHRRDVYRR